MNKTINELKEYIEVKGYADSKNRGLLNIFRKINVWEEVSGVNIDNWSREFLIDLCKNGITLKHEDFENTNLKCSKLIKLSDGISKSSYYGLHTNILYVNEIMSFLGSKLSVNIKDFQDKPLNKKSGLFTKEEIIDICNSLVNVQDKFIIYALFSGIRGNKYEDLTNLKTKDINFETKEILLPSGKVIKMDSYLEDILRDVTDTEFGSIYYKLNSSGLYTTNSFYEFNMYSEYVLKVKPTKSNGNGLGTMSFQGLQTRFKALSKILEETILGVNIYRSGVISRMHDIKDIWTQKETINFLKDNQYNLTAYETQKSYDELYGVNRA